MIASSAERDFYDGHYAQFLRLPDHALRLDRKTLEASLEDPAQPFYERRLLYRAAMRALEAEPVRVMPPGARLVLAETWGGNPVLNAARRLRAWMAGEAERTGGRDHLVVA